MNVKARGVHMSWNPSCEMIGAIDGKIIKDWNYFICYIPAAGLCCPKKLSVRLCFVPISFLPYLNLIDETTKNFISCQQTLIWFVALLVLSWLVCVQMNFVSTPLIEKSPSNFLGKFTSVCSFSSRNIFQTLKMLKREKINPSVQNVYEFYEANTSNWG